MFAPYPDDEEKAVFVPVKLNGGKKRKGLLYEIVALDPNEVDGPSKVSWLGDIDTTANEAVRGVSKPKLRRESAAEWLIERFREKLSWPSDELLNEAKMNGISRNAMFEAKDNLGLPPCRRIILPTGSAVWTWWVPEDWSGFVQVSQSQKNTGTVGTVGTVDTQGVDF